MMIEGRIYLTLSPEKRRDGGYLAVLSEGQPQFGNEEITILSAEVVKNKKAAKIWGRKMLAERPWETKQ
jgi:hypothetical protein